MKKIAASAALAVGACLLTALVWTHPAVFGWKSKISSADIAHDALRQNLQGMPQQASPKGTISASVVGYTSRKTPIEAYTSGNGKKYVLVLGGMHGDEPSSVTVAEAFISSLEQDPSPPDTTVMVIPKLNPDGLAGGTRTNGNGVDINRNFPSKSWVGEVAKSRYNPGREPASEPETRAIIEIIKERSPALVVSVHAPLNCINWDGPADDVAREMSEASGYPLQQDIGYKTPGSLGSYAGVDGNIPTVTIELRNDANTIDLMREGGAALRAALAHMSSAVRAVTDQRLEVSPDVALLLSTLMKQGEYPESRDGAAYVYFNLGGDAYVIEPRTGKYVTKLTVGTPRTWRCGDYAEVGNNSLDKNMKEIFQGGLLLLRLEGKAWRVVARAETDYRKKDLVAQRVPQSVLNCLGIEGY